MISKGLAIAPSITADNYPKGIFQTCMGGRCPACCEALIGTSLNCLADMKPSFFIASGGA